MTKHKPPRSSSRQYQTKSRKDRQIVQKSDSRIWLYAVGGIILLAVISSIILLNRPTSIDESERPLANVPPQDRVNLFSDPPEMSINVAQDYQARLVTEKGEITLDLFESQAPLTVNNFVFLARQGFYDGTTFHRVLDGFMAQSGDPSGTGGGGPGYTFQDETDNELVFDRPGLLAMANAGPGTNGSQFFITFTATPHLNGNHTIFGEVTQGFQVLDSITRRDPMTNPNFTGDQIERVDILVDGQAK